jgi:membrane protease YdiL (CAAX protease family)
VAANHIFVGIAEEMDFRAAGLMTLAGAIGFWPAAILTSLLFAGAHYFFKPMENITDAPNSGNRGRPVATKPLTGAYHGPAWLTGGPLGVEGSWLVLPIIALLFVAFQRLRYNPPVPVQENLGGAS